MANTYFTLDTSSMESVGKACEELAECMRNARWIMDASKENLMTIWDGEGAFAFKTKYQVLTAQLADMTEEMHDMAESIYAAENSYIQTDIDAAKQLDGAFNPA